LFHVLDDELWARGLKALASRLKPSGQLLVLEHFPGAPSDAQHVRWRSLDAYRTLAASLDLTLSRVDTYRLRQIGADKTLLALDKAPTTVPEDRDMALMAAD
jgi:hypothetical protein